MRLRGGGDDSKPDVPSTSDGKEASSRIGDDIDSIIEKSDDEETGIHKGNDKEGSIVKDDEREDFSKTGDKKTSSRAESVNETMAEEDASIEEGGRKKKEEASIETDDKHAGKTAEHAKQAANVKGTSWEAGKRTRRQNQKYKEDIWMMTCNEFFDGDLDRADDSYDDETWAPKEKRRKVYGGSDQSDDEDEETPKKRRKVCSQIPETLPLPTKPLSPVMQGMMEKLAISMADISKKWQTVDKHAASLVIHRWAKKANFPLLLQQISWKDYKEIMRNYGKYGAGVLCTTEMSLRKCWLKHYCSEDTKQHIECYLCAEETWKDFQEDNNGSTVAVPNSESVLEEEDADDNVCTPSASSNTQGDNVDRQENHPCPSIVDSSMDPHPSPNEILEMVANVRAKEREVAQLKATIDDLQRQESSSKSMSTPNESVTFLISKDGAGVKQSMEEETVALQCAQCEAKYKNYSTLVRHCKKKHKMVEEKPAKVCQYKCDECGKSYKEKQVLAQHKKCVHNKPICRFCEKPQSNLKRHEPKCETKKKSTRKKTKCGNCSSEVCDLARHLESCQKKKSKTSPIPTSSLTQQDNFGPLLTSHEERAEMERLEKNEETVQGMEAASVKIASREGISLRLGIRSMANGQCLFESTSAQLLHRRPQDGDESEPLLFQSVLDALGKEGCKEGFEQFIRIKVVEFLWDNQHAFDRFVHTGSQGEVLPASERREEYERQLNELRKENQYAMGAGDLMIDGICAVLGVNILIMRTNTPNEHPFDLHTPAAFGGELKHKSPIFLMYSAAASHYEEARPLDAASEAKLLVVQETYLEHNYWPHRYETGKDPTGENEGHHETGQNSQEVGE